MRMLPVRGKYSMKTEYADVPWNNTRKLRYRQHCIIDNYRWISGCAAIPSRQQYWTMCGNHAKNGDLLSGSELSQMDSSDLLSRSQFHGVDIDEQIITTNRKVAPEANWHLGDLSTVVNRVEPFCPAIVHLDTIHMAQAAAEICRGAIARIEHCDHPVMVVMNVVIKRPVDKRRANLFGFLERFETLVTGEWLVKDEVYIYQGAATKHSSTHLATYVFQFQGRGAA